MYFSDIFSDCDVCLFIIAVKRDQTYMTIMFSSYECGAWVISCALPYMTNVTISTFISQTFLSWVAKFHLRKPMVCLSHSSYGMPGLASLMNVSLWERCDFHVSFLGRYLSGNVWNRSSGSSMVDMGSHQTLWISPLPNNTWHSGTWWYSVTSSIDQTFHLIITLVRN